MSASDSDQEPDNRVFLRGRLADTPLDRELPSGDVLTTFRLTVPRPAGERGRVDSLECVTTSKRARKVLERAELGDQVEVVGSLRRRFWRTPNGAASRYAVDVVSIKLNRSGRRGAASPTRTPASV